MLTAREIAAKWQQKAAAAGNEIRRGVQAVEENKNPMERAARNQEKWATNVAKAARENRFADGCRKVSLDEWKRAMIAKGIPNYQNGLQMGQAKMERFLNSFIPHIQAGLQKIEGMQRGTLEQNLARSAEMIRHLATFRNFGNVGRILDDILGGIPR